MSPRLGSQRNHPASRGPNSLPDGKAIDHGLHLYSSPCRGILAILPASWVPYAQLMRIEKSGLIAFYLPYLIGISYAACIGKDVIPPSSVLRNAGFFWLGSVILRGA